MHEHGVERGGKRGVTGDVHAGVAARYGVAHGGRGLGAAVAVPAAAASRDWLGWLRMPSWAYASVAAMAVAAIAAGVWVTRESPLHGT